MNIFRSFIVIILAQSGVFAQDSVVVEYYKYYNHNDKSEEYILEKVITRLYDEGVEPILYFDSYHMNPLTPTDSYDDVIYLDDNARSIHERSSYETIDGIKYTYTDFFFSQLGDTSIKVRETGSYIVNAVGDTTILEEREQQDSIVYFQEPDFRFHFNIFDYTQEVCDVFKHFVNDSASWILKNQFNECDSIRGDTIWGSFYDQGDFGISKILLQEGVNIKYREFTEYRDGELYSTNSVTNEYYLDSIFVTEVTEVHRVDTLYYNENSFFRSYDRYDSEMGAEEFNQSGKIISAIAPHYAGLNRKYFDNYSLGYWDEEFTIKIDSMVIHYYGVISSSNSDISSTGHLSVYPNPNTGQFTIQMEENKSFTADVFNLEGRAIRKEKGIGSLQLSNLDKGSYIIKLITSQGVSTQRVEVVE